VDFVQPIVSMDIANLNEGVLSTKDEIVFINISEETKSTVVSSANYSNLNYFLKG
jgi:hypothetical protein